MTEIEWVDAPPPDVRKIGFRTKVIERLKEKPGQWALVETDVRNTRAASYRNKGCEAVSRKRDVHKGTDRSDIYARWPEEES